MCATLFFVDWTWMIGFRSSGLISRCNSFLFKLRSSKEQEQRHVSTVGYLISHSLISAFKEFTSRRNLSWNHCLHSPCTRSLDHRRWPRPPCGVIAAMREHFYRSHLGRRFASDRYEQSVERYISEISARPLRINGNVVDIEISFELEDFLNSLKEYSWTSFELSFFTFLYRLLEWKCFQNSSSLKTRNLSKLRFSRS